MAIMDIFKKKETKAIQVFETKVLGVVADFRNHIGTFQTDYKEDPNQVLLKNGISRKELSYLLYDPHLSACVQSRKAGVLSLLWDIDRGNEKDELGKFALDLINSLNLPNVLSEMLDAPLYGFKPMEIIWNYVGENLLPVALNGKPSWWFDFDASNNLVFLDKNSLNGRKQIPKNKFILIQHNATTDNPWGEAILSKCYYATELNRAVRKLWAIYLEKYGMAYLVGKLPTGASTDDQELLLTALKGLHHNSAGVIPADTEINIVDGSNASNAELFIKFIADNNADISKAILSQTLTTEQGTTGSYAMSQTHLQVRQDVIDADKIRCETAINELIRIAIDMNFVNVERYPKIEFYAPEDVDQALADRDLKLSQMNQFKFTPSYFIESYGFKETDFEMIENAGTGGVPNMFTENDKNKSVVYDISKFDVLTRKLIDSILEQINEGETYDDILNTLIEKFPDADLTDIESYIAESITLATAQGVIDGYKGV